MLCCWKLELKNVERVLENRDPTASTTTATAAVAPSTLKTSDARRLDSSVHNATPASPISEVREPVAITTPAAAAIVSRLGRTPNFGLRRAPYMIRTAALAK